ncbi:hypothetical protein N7492_000316 [Penicillium capsulatum]|uniref:Zn(2)-C6 fungal-type domain-containing protein n=1 Tax=Penicillium capsulatum TaxID=69766 RepID=A0A9W9ITA5_9EURO|nr:hypothetical protein N7492_000316 [Penicillium capsulatum]KAJ6130620.1 hypothetical protein N7512_003400 [Penicillium capsulatum]
MLPAASSPMAESTRKRSRAACISCQARKRKCSGENPCSTCAQARIDCRYSTASRKRRARSGSGYRGLALDEPGWSHPAPTVSATGSTTSPVSYGVTNDHRRVGHSLEANSGAAFVRKLGLRIDPARAPRPHLFAWNVGERRPSPVLAAAPSAPPATSITQSLSREEMRLLAAVYFEKVDPCYAFLDQESVLAHIQQRWTEPIEPREQPYDAVLCGIAAFAYLFSRFEILPIELQMVETARGILEKSVLCADTPSIHTVTGWVLRTAYLRMTASPHAAWMASCTLMHLIEAAGIHLNSTDPEATGLLLSTQTQKTHGMDASDGATADAYLHRRVFGMARHLNTWISFDLGRSRVVLHGATSAPARPGAPPSPMAPGPDLFHLLPLSESLDPTGPTPQDLPELETALTSVLDLMYTEPSLILVQCNLMLCIYRRARALNPHAPLSGRLLDHILTLAGRGLRAAREMVVATCPWHQVANVPFQVVCTLLAIDNRAALALLPDAMATLREVLAAYDTSVMREAYSTAYLLIALHQRQKEDDTRALADVLRANAAAAVAEHDISVQREGESQTEIGQEPAQQETTAPVSDTEVSWLGDLMIDMPSLQNFDLDQFLSTDLPWPFPQMGI